MSARRRQLISDQGSWRNSSAVSGHVFSGVWCSVESRSAKDHRTTNRLWLNTEHSTFCVAVRRRPWNVRHVRRDERPCRGLATSYPYRLRLDANIIYRFVLQAWWINYVADISQRIGSTLYRIWEAFCCYMVMTGAKLELAKLDVFRNKTVYKMYQ